MKQWWSVMYVGAVSTIAYSGLISISPIDAQMSVSANTRAQQGSIKRTPEKRTPDSAIENRLVTLSLRNVTLEAALTAIRNQTGVQIAYVDRVVPVNRQVTLVVEKIPILKALEIILRGTNIVPKVVGNGKIALVPRQENAEQDTARGVLKGRVIDATKKSALSEVRVGAEGTRYVALTNREGGFLIDHVPAGKYLVTARLLGYAISERIITISANDTVSVDFILGQVPTRLQEVVTTGAGDRKRLEVGNSIPTIKADEIVPNTPIRNLSDLLKGRAPGVQVMSTSGTAGSGSRIRIRGISSILTTSDPIVIVDGIRVDAAYSQGGPAFLGTQSTTPGANSAAPEISASSRLNDIDPEIIETIEILKGPSASTLYGSDAANGVIVIKTKRGKAGPTRWSFFLDRGMSKMNATFSDAYIGWGRNISSPGTQTCTLLELARKVCSQDSVTHFNPVNHRETSPLGTGHTTKIGGQVSGGTSTMQYFLGADYNDDIGLLELPSYDANAYRRETGGRTPPSWMRRPNVFNALHLTSNLSTQLSSKADVTLFSNITRQSRRDASQSSDGFINAGYQSLGYRDSVRQGWAGNTPGTTFRIRAGDNVNRMYSGMTGRWRPRPHLSAQGTFGLDYTSRKDERFQPADTGVGASASRTLGDQVNLLRSVDLGASLDLPVTSHLQLRSSIGGQYQRTDQDATNITATGLRDGTESITGAFSTIALESHSASATAGGYFNETLQFNDRLFVTGAVRFDAGSSFGQNAKAIGYPKWNASWLLSDEPFFPKITAVTNVRLRTAFGHAGTQPALDARFRSYRTVNAGFDGTSISTIILSTVGNPDLRPERATELEGGMDIGLWNERVSLDVTLYQKNVKDALVTRKLPPSFGLPTRQENIGEVINTGSEISLTVQPIMTPTINLSNVFSISTTRNRLLSLGKSGVSPIVNSPGQPRYVVGYPLSGFWERALLGYDDVNKNGIIEPLEVRLSDSMVYIGQPIPKTTLAWNTSLSLLSGRMTVGTDVVYQGGMTQINSALLTQCVFRKCRGVFDPTTSLTQQAIMASAFATGLNRSYYGLYERVSVTRWNSLSVTFRAPQQWVRITHAKSANISIMGSNLAMWSNYRGADPEVNSVLTGNMTSDDGAVPEPRNWSIRFNVQF